MDEELDNIWSVDLFGNSSYWISEEDYIRIKNLFMDRDIDKSQTAVTFDSVNGAEVVMLLSNISNLQHSTKTSRNASRESNRRQNEEGEKKEWEE